MPAARTREPLLAQPVVEEEPRRDVHGRTLDEALQQDRGVRERVLRRSRQVVDGMRFCSQSRRVALRIAEGSWKPLRKYGSSLWPRTGDQFILLLLGLCFCWPFLIYIVGILLALGVGGSMIGLSLWLLATFTRAVLGWYLKHLLPW